MPRVPDAAGRESAHTVSPRFHAALRTFPRAAPILVQARLVAGGCAVPIQPAFGRLLALAVATTVISGAGLSAASEPAWTLDQQGRTYTYTLTLKSQLPEAVLLDVLFHPLHVAAFSKSAGRLTLLSEEETSNEVRFDTRRLVFKCSTTFRRTLDRESGSIGDRDDRLQGRLGEAGAARAIVERALYGERRRHAPRDRVPPGGRDRQARRPVQPAASSGSRWESSPATSSSTLQRPDLARAQVLR